MQTPCVHVCSLVSATGFCAGCGRTLQEIGSWMSYSDTERRRIMALLPASPLSYHGAILSIRWCVRVRAFFERDREVVGELPFTLGSIPSGRLISP